MTRLIDIPTPLIDYWREIMVVVVISKVLEAASMDLHYRFPEEIIYALCMVVPRRKWKEIVNKFNEYIRNKRKKLIA